MPPRKKTAKGKSAGPLNQDRVILDFAVLGDFAQVAEGKLTIVGAGWNMINAKQYPLQLPFGLGIGILIPWSETNAKHPFRFVLEDADGNQLLSSGGDVEAGRKPRMPAGMSQRVVLGVAGTLELHKPGTYVFVVSAGDDEKRITFEASPIPGLRSAST